MSKKLSPDIEQGLVDRLRAMRVAGDMPEGVGVEVSEESDDKSKNKPPAAEAVAPVEKVGKAKGKAVKAKAKVEAKAKAKAKVDPKAKAKAKAKAKSKAPPSLHPDVSASASDPLVQGRSVFRFKPSVIKERLDALSGSVSSKRHSVPVLGCIYLEARGGVMVMTATDLDMKLECRFGYGGGDIEAICVGLKSLKGVVGSLVRSGVDDEVILSIHEDGQLSLAAGLDNYSLHTIPGPDFPNFEVPAKFPNEFVLLSEDWRFIWQNVGFAISTDEERYYLNGILLETVAGKLRGVATDGYRLAIGETDVGLGNTALRHILPRKTCGELARLIGKRDVLMRFELSKQMARFSFDDWVLSSKLIDGTFPDYNRIVPKKNPGLVTLVGDEFRDAFAKAAAVFADAPAQTTPLVKWYVSSGELVAACSGRGTSKSKLEGFVVKSEGGTEVVGVNPDFMIDVLNRCGVKADVRFATEDDALLITGQRIPVGKATWVVMPMRITK